MSTKRVIGFVFLGIILMTGGCGVADADDGDEFDSRQDTLWRCEVGESWHTEYFSDASLTQWVGAYDCNCDGKLTLFGKKTNYESVLSHPTACPQ